MTNPPWSHAEVRKNEKVYLDHRIATRGTRDVRGLWKLSVEGGLEWMGDDIYGGWRMHMEHVTQSGS